MRIRKQHKELRHVPVRENGVSMLEFLVVTPMIMFLGLGIVQYALVYHAKTILNYATFEAARVGAVKNGQVEDMRKELGVRLAPVYGGDGTHEKAGMSIMRSMVAVKDPTTTSIEIINPTTQAFDDHGYDHANGTRAIPNSHLKYRNSEPGATSSVSIQDANLLKVQVKYGYEMRLPILDMKVPLLEPVLRHLMVRVDPANAVYYARGMLPLKSVATVRMQSEAYENSNLVGATDQSGGISSNIYDVDGSGDGTNSFFDCNGDGLPDGLKIGSFDGDTQACGMSRWSSKPDPVTGVIPADEAVSTSVLPPGDAC